MCARIPSGSLRLPEKDALRNGEASRPRLFLVDALALLYRAHFGFINRPLTTSRGMSVGALFGFLTTLHALMRDERAEHIAVAFDSPGPTLRHQRYPLYKAHRPPMPAELAAQVPYLYRLSDALGLPSVMRDGYEADDLIGSLAHAAQKAGWEVVIVSADKDFAQLIGDGIRQFVPARGREPARWIDRPDVLERWGVEPGQFIDFLALTGDSTDNIPGVAGIGPKTAAALLQAHGSLAGIYADLAAVDPPGVRAKLERSRADADLSRELATIRTDLFQDVPQSFPTRGAMQSEALRALLEELEFRSLEDRLLAGETPPAQGSLLQAVEPPEDPSSVPASRVRNVSPAAEVRIKDGWGAEYGTLRDVAELAGVLEGYNPALGPFGIDTETAGLDARHAPLVGLSIAWIPGRAWYLPVGHCHGQNLPLDLVRQRLGPLLAARDVVKLGQNLAFDLKVLNRHGLPVRGPLIDTMVASYVRDPEARHGLNDLAREMLGHEKVPISALIGVGRGEISMADVAIEHASPYACEDVDAAVRLWPLLRERLEAVSAGSLFRDLEMPLVPVLVSMEEAGILLDARVLAALGESIAGELIRKEAEIHRLAGVVFNVNSPRQLQQVLFERLKLGARRKTKTGFSTDQKVLEELAGVHPLAQEILDYRQLAKLKSTYVESLPRMVDPATGRIHARFHQTITATGRLSSSDPNLQNIPIRTPLGREVRRAFVAPQRRVFISADYSQIELRVLAHLSGDENLCSAFRAGADVHRATAARVFGVEESAVTSLMRARAKTINFGILYGMGAQRLAGELRIPVRQAAGFIRDYFDKLPRLKAYIDGCVEQARARGYAETLLGRRRYLPDLTATHPRDRAAAERMAVNSTVQGSAADLIKRAMVGLQRAFEEHYPETRLLLQVHDELLCEAPAEAAPAIAALLRREMEAVLPLAVPLRAEVGIGRDWYDAHA